MDATKSTDTTSNTLYESDPSLTLSSGRFNFNSLAEDPSIDHIDKVGSMFAEFKKGKPPTLRDALKSMDYGEKTEELLRIFTDKANEKLEELEAPGLNTEDVATIFCYTYEWDEDKFGNDIDSPYRKLNKSISIDRSNPVFRKTRAFLFLLLQALRKLPRYTPANKTLYRGINIHVQTEMDLNFPNRKPYAAGNEKTWWAFASTSEDLEVTRDFVEDKEGTLITLSGEAWGYDISIFSNYPDEKEVLLEPERRLSIKSVKKDGTIIAVNAEVLNTPLVMKDFIKVNVTKIKDRKSTNEDVPRNLKAEKTTISTVTLSWDAPEVKSDKVLSYQVSVRQTSDSFINRNPESTYIARKGETRYTVRGLGEGKEYEFRVRCKYKDGWGRRWSEKEVVRIPEYTKCVWKECPDAVDEDRKYSVDENNPRIATRINDNDNDDYCTIIGNTPIPLNAVISWSTKILDSKDNNGDRIYIGIAPSDISQDHDYNYYKCGWYFDCCHSALYSGPPHNYSGKEYGPRKEEGSYVRTGDRVGVVMDMARGELSFVLNGVGLGIAYEKIQLDKPLVPCVILGHEGDSIELDTSEVEENIIKKSIFIPSNIIAKSEIWYSITLTWDEVSDASFYQIEVDGSKSYCITSINTFTKIGFSNTEHSFRVRAVRGNSVGKWSGAVKGRTLKAPEFKKCVWKQCPDDVVDDKKYVIDGKNPRLATKIKSHGAHCCRVIGDTHIPPNTVTSLGVKVFKSKYKDGYNIYIGVAPPDIDRTSDEDNYDKCGWYFNCYDSALYSGPPHNHRGKEYGPRGKEEGQYVQTGDSVGIVMDAIWGELSFTLNSVNLGVAYKGIPLDKPLVPCVHILCANNSVELVI